MRRAAAAAAFAAALSLGPACGADPVERVTSIADQTEVNLTVYNGSIALIHDRRTVPLDRDQNRIAWRDVSALMDPTSAVLEDVTAPGAVRVVEQNFNYDVITPAAILAKYVGHDVVVVHPHDVPGRPLREAATLLSTDDGIVLKYANRVETQLDGRFEFPGLPATLRDRPTLVLDLASDAVSRPELDLSYITGGLAWHAEYVGTVSPDENYLDLSGLVTLSNTSGTSFEDAHLQLVAGNVNVPQPTSVMLKTIARVSPRGSNAFRQENYFEYHLYTLDRATSIANNQTKQVALLDAHHVPIVKTLELRGSPYYYSRANADLGNKLEVGVYETFQNKDGDLGIPLPGGLVRLYKNDSAGTSLFLGADSIDHTPRNEFVRLHLGDSFDITAHKKQTDFQIVTDCTFRSSYEIVIKNGKPEPADVLVVEPIPGDWSISSENREHRKSSSSTATWTVRVAPGDSSTLDYTALVKVCAA